MLTHRKRTKAAATAAVIAPIIALLMVLAHQGTAAAQGQLPPAPQNPMVHLIAGDGQEPQVRVSWDAPAPGTAASHTVSRNDGQSFAVPGGATTYSDRAIVPGTAYSYTVTAENAAGSSSASVSATAQVPSAPSMPGDFAGSEEEPAASDETATVTLTWTASTAPEAEACETAYPLTGYTITRTSGEDTEELGSPGSGDTSFTDSAAAFSTGYTYRIHAQSAIGASPAAEVMVKVLTRPVDPPTNLTASITDPFDGNVSLSWDAPTAGADIISYLVLRYLGADPFQGNNIPATIDALSTGTTTVDETAEAGVTYSYMVMALSADNVSDPSGAASIEAPAAPAGLTADVGDGAIDLSWPAPAGTAGAYRVERQEQNGQWQNLVDTAANTHSDTTAEGNTQYIYQVQHRNTHGGSAWTQSDPVTLVLVPGRPTGLTATARGNDNVLTWTAPDSPFIDGYRVRHRSGDAGWSILASDLPGAAATHTHQDAQADVTHHYAALAHNSAGDGPWSETASTGRITPPLAPTGINAALDGDNIVLTWTKPNSVHVSGYTARHQAGAGQPFTESGRLDGTATSYRLQDIAGDTIYRLMVRAHNDGGDSPWSDPVEIERVLFPTAPTGVSVATDDQNITLTWSAPDTGRVAGYHVSYGAAGSDERQSVNRESSETSFVHTDNVEGAAYQYRVRAHNQAGNGPWSEPVQATRLLVPAAPSGVTAVASAQSIAVSWTAPDGGIVETYEIEYGVSGSTVRETASVDGAETLFIHTGSQGDTQHDYRVRSVNAAGASGWTGTASAMWIVPPRVPSEVTADISGDDILVSWTAPPGGFIDGYDVELRQKDREDWTRHTQDGQATSYTHSSPEPGTTYQYRVRTFNDGGSGVSNWSRTATATWYQGAAPPGAIITQPWNAQLLVRWSPSTTAGVTGYEVRHRVDGGEWSSETVTISLVFHDWDRDTEDLREYSVRSQKDDAYGDWSAIRRFTIEQPSAVTGVTANRESSNGVRLHWDEPNTGKPVQYFIEYNTGNDTWTRSGISAGYKPTHRFDHQPYGATYTYRVVAVNDVYTRGPVTEASQAAVTMPADHRRFTDMPDNLKIKMLDRDRVRLTWDAPADYPETVTGYRIYRKEITDPGVPATFGWQDSLVQHTGGAGRTFIDTTAQPGQLYAYAAAAYRPGSNVAGPASHPTYARPW